jgi:hypothetical protein
MSKTLLNQPAYQEEEKNNVLIVLNFTGREVIIP